MAKPLTPLQMRALGVWGECVTTDCYGRFPVGRSRYEVHSMRSDYSALDRELVRVDVETNTVAARRLLQVKATRGSRDPSEPKYFAFPIEVGQVRKYSEHSRLSGTKWLLSVPNLYREAVFIFNGDAVEQLAAGMKRHDLVDIPYQHVLYTMRLLVEEIEDGLARVGELPLVREDDDA